MTKQAKTTHNAAPVGGAILYRINVAQAKLGVSRSTIYRLVKDGQPRIDFSFDPADSSGADRYGLGESGIVVAGALGIAP